MGNIKKPSVSPNTNGLTSSSHSEKALYPISDCSTSSSFCQSFSECEELNKKFQPKKEKSLLLSEVYQRLKLDKKSERVSDCGSFLRFAHELDLDTGSFSDKGKLHYANFCRDRLCPTCSWRKGLKLYSQISRCIPEIVKDYKCLFLTLTVPNCSEQDFSKTIDRLMFAWNRLTKYKKFKTVIKGFFRILEVTRNKDNGSLHPHFHIILVVSKSYGKHQETYFTRDEFLELWRKAYQDETITQVDIRLIRDKSICDISTCQTEVSLNKAVREVCKYTLKDSDFLNDKISQSEQDNLVFTLLHGLYHRRLAHFGGVFKEIFQKLKLEDVEDETCDLVHIEDTVSKTVALLICSYGWGYGSYKLIDSYIDYQLDKKEVI